MTVTFESIYGGLDKVPPSLLTPASHFKRFKRIGQRSTLVRVVTSEGIEGFGEAFGLPSPYVPAAAVETALAPLVLGQDPREVTRIYAELEAYLINLGHSRGPYMEALSAIDIALWDITGKIAGKPVAELLGASTGLVSTYVSPVPFTDDPADAARTAREYATQGFTAIKTKVGNDRRHDLANLEAVRYETGPGMRILIDANGAFDVAGAIEFARLIEHLDIGWFEEPVAANDLEGLRKVRSSIGIPVAWGENEFTRLGVSNAIRREAIDIVQPNITRAGGITGAKRIADYASENGVAFAPHGVGTGLGVTAMLHVCRAASSFDVYEANRLVNPLRDEYIKTSATWADGAYSLNSEPGLGLELDWARLHDRFAGQAAHA